jgi:hypothetical protein
MIPLSLSLVRLINYAVQCDRQCFLGGASTFLSVVSCWSVCVDSIQGIDKKQVEKCCSLRSDKFERFFFPTQVLRQYFNKMVIRLTNASAFIHNLLESDTCVFNEFIFLGSLMN